jgi:hypothetical protein
MPTGEVCDLCGKPSPGGVRYAYHVPGYRPNAGAPKPSGSSNIKGLLVGLGVVVLLIAGGSAIFGGNDGGCTDSGGDDTSALESRSCEIIRDIASDYSSGVDSLSETRDRLKDLLNGYGQSLPADLAVPLQGVVSGLTTGRIGLAADSLKSLDSACSSRGY